MSPRTFKTTGVTKEEISSDAKNALLKKIAEKIQSYMENGLGEQTFDEWHKELCEYFLNGDSQIKGLKGLLKDAGKDSKQATFGKAQKIINMTFKYMYCFDDADQYCSKFEPCHMPLDSYILDWFFYHYKKEWRHPINGKAKLTRTGTYKLPVWSDLKYAQGGSDIIPQYREIQEWIEGHLGKKQISRLEAEFLIWWESRNDEPYTY